MRAPQKMHSPRPNPAAHTALWAPAVFDQGQPGPHLPGGRRSRGMWLSAQQRTRGLVALPSHPGGKPGRTGRQAEGSSPPEPPGAEPLPVIGHVKRFPEAGGWCEDSSPSTLLAELASHAASADSAMWSEGLSNDCSAHIQSVPQKSSSQAHLPAFPAQAPGMPSGKQAGGGERPGRRP